MPAVDKPRFVLLRSAGSYGGTKRRGIVQPGSGKAPERKVCPSRNKMSRSPPAGGHWGEGLPVPFCLQILDQQTGCWGLASSFSHREGRVLARGVGVRLGGSETVPATCHVCSCRSTLRPRTTWTPAATRRPPRPPRPPRPLPSRAHPTHPALPRPPTPRPASGTAGSTSQVPHLWAFWGF